MKMVKSSEGTLSVDGKPSLNGFEEVDVLVDVMDKGSTEGRILSVDLARSADFTFTSSLQFQSRIPYSVMVQLVPFLSTLYMQVRKHKKARINKKWAKRYGYRLRTNSDNV